ncbi:unnamed protein product [Aphanomyces euteiches]
MDDKVPTKKKRVFDLLKRPPVLANVNFIGPLPQHLLFDTIAAWTVGLLNLRELLTLSLVSRSFYYAMDRKYWETIMTSPQFQPMYAIAAFGKLHPRKRAVRVVSKRMCSNCLAMRRKISNRCGRIMRNRSLFIRYEDEVSHYGVKRFCTHCRQRQPRDITPRELANGTHLLISASSNSAHFVYYFEVLNCDVDNLAYGYQSSLLELWRLEEQPKIHFPLLPLWTSPPKHQLGKFSPWPSTANEPLKKKQRATDVTKSPPLATHELQFMGSLPQDLFFATIGSPTRGLLEVQDLVALSLVSRSFYNTMDDAYWEKTLALGLWNVLSRLPIYTEIRHEQAASQYGLTQEQLESIPSRVQHGPYSRLYVLQDVRDLALRFQQTSDTN